MDSVAGWLLKTLAEKVLLPFNEVAKQLRVVGNYWQRFVSFSRKSQPGKDADASSVPSGSEGSASPALLTRRSIEDTPVIARVLITPSHRVTPPPPPLAAFLKRKVWWHLFD